jgi:hypothetical protein
MRKASLALLAGLTFGAPTAAFADDAQRPVAVEVAGAKAPVRAPVQDASSYAEREQASKQAAEFEGGQTVIVFSGAALVALLLLLILI